MPRLPLRTALAGLLALLALGSAHAQVGMASIRADSLDVTLVYPTAAASRPTTLGPFTVDVAMDAVPLAQRHRLVVMSHGTGGDTLSDHALAAALARAGFVVAQPLHQGDNFRDHASAGPASFRQRPQEVSQVIDALGRDPRWSGRLALDKVGVHGMSAGGVTGIALAGGQWRTLDLVRHCQAHAQDDAGFCFQGARDGAARSERQASYDRARFVPEAFLPAALKAVHGGVMPGADRPDPRPDPRVASVTLAVPVAVVFSPESLARIRIPVGVVGAQADQVLLPRFHSGHLLQHCRSCTLLADLPGGHFDVLSPWPDSVARDVAATQVRGGSPTPGFDAATRDAAQARIVAFHRDHLQP